MCADTTVHKEEEEEEDPSDGESDYVHAEDALLSDYAPPITVNGFFRI